MNVRALLAFALVIVAIGVGSLLLRSVPESLNFSLPSGPSEQPAPRTLRPESPEPRPAAPAPEPETDPRLSVATSSIPVGFTREQLSLKFRKVRISSVTRKPSASSAETLALSVSLLRDETVRINGWRVETKTNSFTIPRIPLTHDPFGGNPPQDLVLKSGDTVRIYGSPPKLGAGFRLAALDLELRGAGNLLGAEQHGHLNAIGIDLYMKMLEQTVEELKGAAPKPEVRAALNLGLDIKIPAAYIADESQRLRMYKRIAGLSVPDQRVDLEAELTDRYGPMPPSVLNLLRYALLKSTAERLMIQSIEKKADDVWVRFHPEAPVNPEKLALFVQRRRGASFRPDGTLRFRLATQNGDLFEQIQNALRELHAAH